jgi:broad-specificity NMP kinase
VHDHQVVICFVAGAPGSGKSSIAELLVERLPHFVVLDMDLLLDTAGALAGTDLRSSTAADLWPAYNHLWLQLIRAISVAHPVVVLGPLNPDEIADKGIRWAVLDCSDEGRRARLEARGYGEAAIRDALDDAAALRRYEMLTIATDDATPDQIADAVVQWTDAGSESV